MAHEGKGHGPGSINQHKGMATSGRVMEEAGEFGVGAYPGTQSIKTGVPENKMGETLSDKERSGPPSIHYGEGQMAAQAHSHHGEHEHGHVHCKHVPMGHRPHHVR